MRVGFDLNSCCFYLIISSYICTGAYKNGMKHGFGRLTIPFAPVYEGNFEFDKKVDEFSVRKKKEGKCIVS